MTATVHQGRHREARSFSVIYLKAGQGHSARLRQLTVKDYVQGKALVVGGMSLHGGPIGRHIGYPEGIGRGNRQPLEPEYPFIAQSTVPR